jgi:hypothetical protein
MDNVAQGIKEIPDQVNSLVRRRASVVTETDMKQCNLANKIAMVGAARQHSWLTPTEVVDVDAAVINKWLLTVVTSWKWSSGSGHIFVHRGPS